MRMRMALRKHFLLEFVFFSFSNLFNDCFACNRFVRGHNVSKFLKQKVQEQDEQIWVEYKQFKIKPLVWCSKLFPKASHWVQAIDSNDGVLGFQDDVLIQRNRCESQQRWIVILKTPWINVFRDNQCKKWVQMDFS